MPDASQAHPGSSPELLFAGWLTRHEAGAEPDFEALCAEHGAHCARLRELHARWSELEQLRRQAGLGGSLSEKLKTHFGSGIDPEVTLEWEEEASAQFSSKVLSQLADRAPASTRYRVKEEVAHGGMGAVLRVWDEDLRRHLAMKVMLGRGRSRGKGDTPSDDDRMLARFLEEAQVTGQLDHPGIVPVHELGLDAEGRVYFTMKLVKGRTLKEVFDELARGSGQWTQTRVLGLIQKVCEAMSYAHAKRVIHRDLKPANVMVGRFGEVFVMDWGLARILGRDDDRDIRIRSKPALATSELRSERQDQAGQTPDSPLYTMDGDVVGTPAYMSPEQARGDLEAMGPHSDVYAVGAMLYHLLAGHMPYVPPGLKASNYSVWRWVSEGPPKSLASEAPDAPAELIAICERAMAREAGARYEDMSSLAADLAAYVEGRVVNAYEAGAWAEARKWVQRNKPLAVALAAAIGAVTIGGVAFALKADEATRAAELARGEAQRADAKAGEAQTNLALAQRNAVEAQARADDVLRLSALQDLEDLLAESDVLWPAHPDKIEGLRNWMAKADKLIAELPRHRTKRAELRALALPQTEQERGLERESHPDYARLTTLSAELESRRRAHRQRREGLSDEPPAIDWSQQPDGGEALNTRAWPLVDPGRTVFGREAEGRLLALRALELAEGEPRLRARLGVTLAWACLAVGRDEEALDAMQVALEAAPQGSRTEVRRSRDELEAAVRSASSEEGLRAAEQELARLQDEWTELELAVGQRQDWRFPEQHAEARWWNAQLTKLIEGLEALQSGLLAEDAFAGDHGWSVPKRLSFAYRLEAGFAEDGEYSRAWAEAMPAIEAAYPGLDLTPQMGLAPLGQDLESGLWEFAHLMSGEPAYRGADGRLVVTEETGVVLVLLRGGSFWMGGQGGDPGGHNYIPGAHGNESPVHEVELSPYFLSKYEMTQGQWLRLAGSNPSYYQETGMAPTLVHPVEQVSWLDCVQWLPRMGLSLPSEAQWEQAVRGGSETPWWTGEERETLQQRHAANLADQAAARAGATWGDIKNWPELDDGYAIHAPPGTFAANAFGLHEMTGNLWEWCLDGYDGGFYARSPKSDPVCPGRDTVDRIIRGGSFAFGAVSARSSFRFSHPSSGAANGLGLRPAWTLTD